MGSADSQLYIETTEMKIDANDVNQVVIIVKNGVRLNKMFQKPVQQTRRNTVKYLRARALLVMRWILNDIEGL